jgi:hypothetical protein
LDKHWDEARVDAELVDGQGVILTSKNVSALTFSMPAGFCPLDCNQQPQVTLDRQTLAAPRPLSDRSWKVHFRKENSRWAVVEDLDGGTLWKKHGVQGPIDDAFMDAFMFVRPSGSAWNEHMREWTRAQLSKAIAEWRAQFRGDVRVKDDSEVTEADIASSHLILWGDPGSNRLLDKIVEKLPLKWDRAGIQLGIQKYSSTNHLPVLIYPNPLNPKRYVVLNSGFTFSKPRSSSNADQTPKLPDYAIVNIHGPKSVGVDGAVVKAGFFNESWQLEP